MAFKKSSDLARAKSSRKQMLYDLPSYPENLDAGQKKENLVAYKKYVEEKYNKLPKNSPERKMCGYSIEAINLEIHKLNVILLPQKAPLAIFKAAAKEVLSEFHFNLIQKRANEIFQEQPDGDSDDPSN